MTMHDNGDGRADSVPVPASAGSAVVPAEPDDMADAEVVVTNPPELMRLVNMLQALMFEVHDLTLDEGGRLQLLEVHRRAVELIRRIVSTDLQHELTDLGLPLEDVEASESAIKIAQAQLVGWLNGLLQGIQAAIMSQRFVPLEQVQEMQRRMNQANQSRPVGQYL